MGVVVACDVGIADSNVDTLGEGARVVSGGAEGIGSLAQAATRARINEYAAAVPAPRVFNGVSMR
jgi:hypothetical protein